MIRTTFGSTRGLPLLGPQQAIFAGTRLFLRAKLSSPLYFGAFSRGFGSQTNFSHRHAVLANPRNVSCRSASTNNSAVGFTMDQAGLAADLYVPPRDLPSWFTHPGIRWKVLKRRIQILGLNTYMVVKLRKDIGRKRFRPLEWKETALLLYTRANECFVKRDLRGLNLVSSRWVAGPLSARAQKLPRDYVFSWKLDKLNSRPKVLSLIPLALPNAPAQYVQVVYRIDSMQTVSKTKKGTDKVDKITRRVVDNVAFIFDTSKDPTEGRLIGSLFETPATAPMPDPTAAPGSRADIMAAMASRGDIFRNPPEYVAVKGE